MPQSKILVLMNFDISNIVLPVLFADTIWFNTKHIQSTHAAGQGQCFKARDQGQDKPGHDQDSMISSFAIHFLNRIIPIVAKLKLSRN